MVVLRCLGLGASAGRAAPLMLTNQYHGVRDLDLAVELAKSLGIDTGSLGLEFKGKCSAVQAIKEAVMDQ